MKILVRRAADEYHKLRTCSCSRSRSSSPPPISRARLTSPQAWERLIDRLLASPHYGERWGRYWLDLVRYADSGGFERDFDWLNAWRYRDYVVRAFNEDKPYNQFIREQIAGDEIDPSSSDAAGYLRLGLDNNIKDERTRMDELDDLIQTTSLSFLGLTVGCARCHNHKFGPIPQKDYYRLQAVFFSTKPVEYPLVSPEVVASHAAEQKSISSRQAPSTTSERLGTLHWKSAPTARS